MTDPIAVAVFCASSERVNPFYPRLAGQVGAELAARGWTLVSGGGSVGMMGALARAARAAGARTVGVIPRALAELEVADHDADELVVTSDMRERKGLMDARADAFLTLPGGIGTLEELLEIWVSRSLGMHAKPVVVLDPLGDFAPLRAQIERLVTAGFVRSSAAGEVRWAQTVAEAFGALEAGLASPHGRDAPADEFLEADL